MSGEESSSDESRQESESTDDRSGRPRRAQPEQPPAQPNQGGPQTAGGGALDELDTDELIYVVGVFGLIGAGIGLIGVLGPLFGSTLVKATIKIVVALAGVSVVVAGGPVVGVLTGLGIDDRMNDRGRPVFLTAGASGVVGHLLMMVVAILLLSVGIDSSGSGGGAGGGASSILNSFGDFLLPLVLIAVATGLVSAGAAYLKEWSRSRGVPA